MADGVLTATMWRLLSEASDGQFHRWYRATRNVAWRLSDKGLLLHNVVGGLDYFTITKAGRAALALRPLTDGSES